MPSSSPPPLSFSVASLRLATLNVGLGFTRKLPAVLSRCTDLSLDVLALQEVGDPPLLHSVHGQYILVVAPGPSAHTSGVGLLISTDLAPRCRTYKRSESGRLVGVVLELTKGHQLLIVSAYMPSGLDHRAPTDDAQQVARDLYAELDKWSRGMKQVVCMGDLNETLTAHDRYPKPSHSLASRASPIRCLSDAGYTDVYRHLHPDSVREPGFTHFIDSLVRPSRSRIDYIWSLGAPLATLLRARVDNRLRLSHHRLLLVDVELPAAAPPPCSRPLVRVRLPNLRHSPHLDEQRDSFILHLESKLHASDGALRELARESTATSLSALATDLTQLAHRSAWTNFPLTGTSPRRNKTVLTMQRHRRALTGLLHLSVTLHTSARSLTRCPQWRLRYQHCLHYHQQQWSVDPYFDRDDAGWIAETRSIVSRLRHSIMAERHRLTKVSPAPVDVNMAASVHRMLASDALPAQLFSVVDSRGELTTNADELEDAMVQHFEAVFALPETDSARPLHPPPPPMLLDKPGILDAWYDGLMAPVTDDELTTIVADVPLVTAPGRDGVSTGVWKLAIQHSPLAREHITALFSACLSTSTFPSAWKTSVITPLVKDAKKERTMNNIRPISLQSCLGKLLTRLLAHRLSAILQRHPILNPSQTGFILGGTTMKCVDELLDAWDWSRNGGHEFYTILYDIKQAYDSVQAPVLARALRRLHLPAGFIALVVDSLTDLTSCVRTPYGVTRSFAVQRSIRQGDPLSGLLFVLLMDALHDGLDLNPFTLGRHGCRLAFPTGDVEVASLGYADDSAALTNSLPDLQVQNDWVQYFMQFNSMCLNPSKCELVGRAADGSAVTEADLLRHNITIDGVPLTPVPHGQAVRYLGVHVTFGGSWSPQQQKARSAIALFSRIATKFHLSIAHAVYMFNVFLAPRLELALHYVHGAGAPAWIKECDSTLFRCITRLAGSPLHLSHSMLATTLGMVVPSALEIGVKVSELFLRINAADTRWSVLGRCVMRAELPCTVDATTPLPRLTKCTRVQHAAHHAVKKLGWSLHMPAVLRPSARRTHLFDVVPLAALPTLADCSSSPLVTLTETSIRVAHDIWSGWDHAAYALRDVVHVYTDGSFEPTSATSAWSVVIADQWFDDNFAWLPVDECELGRRSHVLRGATLIGSSIDCTAGIYPAELQAIARTLAMFPLSARLHVHTDSLAAITAIDAYGEQQNDRRRLRMSARTILQLIAHLQSRRREAGGHVDLSHVPAHTDHADAHSVGNRLADYQAQLARTRSDRSTPLGLRPLPLASCERHLHLEQEGSVVIDDIRRTSLALLKARRLTRWAEKPEQGRFAGVGTIALGRDVVRDGTEEQQRTLVHVASNSIHRLWVTDDDDHSHVGSLRCVACDSDLTLDHVALCLDAPCEDLRQTLHTDICALLARHAECRRWCEAMGHAGLRRLLLSLFPLPDSAAAAEVADHLTRCMVGAFTRAQCTAAMHSLGIADLDDGRRTLTSIRLRCLDRIGTFYCALKDVA